MRILSLLVITVGYLLCAQTAEALQKKFDVYLVSVGGFQALSQTQVNQAFNVVKAKYKKDLNIDLRLWRHERFNKSPVNCGSSLSTFPWTHECWTKWFSRRISPSTRDHKLQLVVLPPIVESGSWWTAGLASGECMVRTVSAVAVVTATMVNAQGAPRFNYATTGIEHELGHLLGAEHDPTGSCYVMDYGALGCLSGRSELPFSELSREDFNECLDFSLIQPSSVRKPSIDLIGD